MEGSLVAGVDDAVGPALGDDLVLGPEAHAFLTVLADVAEARALPATEAVIADRDRDRHVDADHPDIDPGGELARRVAVAGEDRDAIAIGVLGWKTNGFLEIARADHLPSDTRLTGSTTTRETGSYTLRPFGRPLIEGYFGGEFARSLESQGEGAFAAFAIEQICGALGNDMRKRLSPIKESTWARDPFALGSYSYGNPGAQAMRARLAAPVDGRMFFAGEHTSRTDFSTAHGAYRTGVKAADAAINALQAQPV